MKKLAALLLTGLVTASIAAPAVARNDERTATARYTIARGRIHTHPTDSWIGTQREFFRARSGERWVTLSLVDQTGQPVLGRVEVGKYVVEFCGTTDEPIRLLARRIAVSAILGPCGPTFSIVTEGRITAAFSR